MATTPAAPQDLAAILDAILRDHGTGILDQRSILQDELRERAPGARRGVHLLMTAFDAGVPLRLKESGSPFSDFKLGQETAQIVDHFGSSPESAREAVETWAKVIAGAGDIPETVSPPPSPATSAELSALAQSDWVIVTAAPEPAAFASEPPQTAPAPAPAETPPQPAVPAAARILPLPAPAEPASPLPAAAAPAEPAARRPLPLPLPGAAPAAAAVRPLPGGVRPLPLPGASPQAAALPPPGTSNLKWLLLVPLVFVGIGGGLWAAGVFNRPVLVTDPPNSGPATPQAGATTDEGYAIAEVDNPRPFKAQQIDGNPNTLLFAFGLRSGGETYTYQAAVGFEGRSTSGAGLIKAVKKGQEASTGQLDVTRITQADGYVGFTMSGKLAGAKIGAPSICVSALAGKGADKLDVRDGGGGFCAFATTATGVCDGNTKLGCGDLVP